MANSILARGDIRGNPSIRPFVRSAKESLVVSSTRVSRGTRGGRSCRKDLAGYISPLALCRSQQHSFGIQCARAISTAHQATRTSLAATGLISSYHHIHSNDYDIADLWVSYQPANNVHEMRAAPRISAPWHICIHFQPPWSPIETANRKCKGERE